MNKKYLSLVTGGAGFIGSNLVDKLIKVGHKVIVLDNFCTGRRSNLSQHNKKFLKIINVDITSAKVEKYFRKVDFVFHLAGLADIVPSIENPEKYFEVNVTGTLRVLEAAKKNKVKKFIYAASASCYGIPKKVPTKETSEIKTMYPYALTKFQGEQLVMQWFKNYKLPTISLRFFNAYGLRSRTSGAYGAVFGVFLAQRISDRPLTVVGSGNQTRDFIHVSDLVNVILKAAKSPQKGKIYNVGGGKEVKINKIVKLIGGRRISIPKRPGEPDRSLADISKITKDMNWRPRVNINEGVKELLKNLNQWKKAPVWTPKKIKIATKLWFELVKNKK
jgi:UDP-glucose 4-epimerase